MFPLIMSNGAVLQDRGAEGVIYVAYHTLTNTMLAFDSATMAILWLIRREEL